MILDSNLQWKVGIAAYKTIYKIWNAKVAAKSLLELYYCIKRGKTEHVINDGPCSMAPIISENRMHEYVCT